MPNRKPYPSDVSDEEWAFAAPYLALVREDAPQRNHDLREVLNGLRWVVRTGSPWRYMPHDLPPWEAIYQQTRRWLSAGVFEAMVHDLRILLRLSEGRASEPTASILDSRTLRSTPESGARAGYDGAKRKRGSKVHAAVDTLGHLLRTPARLARQSRRRAGPGAGGRASRGRPRGHGGVGGAIIRGSGLHRRATGRRSGGSRHPFGSGQASGVKAGLRATAAQMGCGARFRMGIAIPSVSQGLRAATGNGGRAALCRLRLSLPSAGDLRHWSESITRSRAAGGPRRSLSPK
jgi:transposase